MPLTDDGLSLVKTAQELLRKRPEGQATTPQLIADIVGRVMVLMPVSEEDRQEAINELIRRNSTWTGNDTSVSSDTGHLAWLNSDRKKDWRYWQRYREWLEREWSWRSVEALDRSTDLVLGFLEDPIRPGPWDRRGLVVGQVQSGKTSHYTGLISKAADAGYKIIIVLAGLHNNLRSQTQMRLDEGFLGYETSPDRGKTVHPVIGVGLIDGDGKIQPNYATNRSEAGDFSKAVVKNLGISPEQRPWLFVIKKNKSVLTHLLQWIEDHVADPKGSKRVPHLPLLVIDDEADNASVDTGATVLDENGQVDLEHQPKAINSLIRKILVTFQRSAYVGYTATPFANVFIHDQGETKEEGPDLFPAAFIVNLASPSNYVGPTRIFGRPDELGRVDGLPVVNLLPGDQDEWMPARHDKGHLPRWKGEDKLPPSLQQAVNAFLLVCAARRVRRQGHKHCSMLIHVSRFSGSDGGNSVQQRVFEQVEEHVGGITQRIRRRIDHEEVLKTLQALWHGEFVAKAHIIQEAFPDLCGPTATWEQVLAELPPALEDLRIRRINGTAKDVLDYEEHKQTGLKVIAIGGDKLSRGLTLEGLTVSYFLRASKMYDTLMQMGRWFGYRPGYLDLCRLYTTRELVEWFCHITDASEELREEFDLMAAQGTTPKEFGLKVLSHPSLLVTSPVKMRHARELQLSFSGELVETVALRRDRGSVEHNLEETRRLIEQLGRPTQHEKIERDRPDGSPNTWSGHLWEDVPAEKIIAYLRSWRSHPNALKVQGGPLAEFIQKMVDNEAELTRWTVALLGGKCPRTASFGGLEIRRRERRGDGGSEDRYSIGRLIGPRDEAIDLDSTAWALAMEQTMDAWRKKEGKPGAGEPKYPSGPAIRRVRGFGRGAVSAHPERGLLLLSALDPEFAYRHEPGLAFDFDLPIMAFAISFPNSKSTTRKDGTRVCVNNVGWEQQYGAAE
jgi:hypothetical protein